MSYPQGPPGPSNRHPRRGNPQGTPAPWPPQPQLPTPGSLSGPQPGWEPQMMAHPHPEPRSYPLMLRTWDYRWWKPVVGILLLVVGVLVVMPLLLIPVLAVAVALEGGPGRSCDRFAWRRPLDVGHPVRRCSTST